MSSWRCGDVAPRTKGCWDLSQHKDEKVDVGPTRLLAGHTAAAHKGKPRAGLLWATALCGSTNTLCVQKENVRWVENAVRARLVPVDSSLVKRVLFCSLDVSQQLAGRQRR